MCKGLLFSGDICIICIYSICTSLSTFDTDCVIVIRGQTNVVEKYNRGKRNVGQKLLAW